MIKPIIWRVFFQQKKIVWWNSVNKIENHFIRLPNTYPEQITQVLKLFENCIYSIKTSNTGKRWVMWRLEFIEIKKIKIFFHPIKKCVKIRFWKESLPEGSRLKTVNKFEIKKFYNFFFTNLRILYYRLRNTWL